MGGISKSSKDEETPKWVHAMAGGLAGAVSRLVVGPLDVVKIRMQVQLEPIARGAHSKYSGVVQALSTIVKEEGVQVRSECSASFVARIRAVQAKRHIQSTPMCFGMILLVPFR